MERHDRWTVPLDVLGRDGTPDVTAGPGRLRPDLRAGALDIRATDIGGDPAQVAEFAAAGPRVNRV